MDKQTARKIVKDALEEPFDKEKFTYLIKNVLHNMSEENSFAYMGNLIFHAFSDSVGKLERIGKYEDHTGRTVDVLIVHLKKETSLERARTMQRNYIAKYLNGSRDGQLKDAALVAFVAPTGKDWRFSFVKMDYRFNEEGKIKEDLTPARRFSFLVGEHENSHTAQSQLLPLLMDDKSEPDLDKLEDAFSIERVTKEFFEKYRNLFLHLKDSLDAIIEKYADAKGEFTAKNIDTGDFAKKLLGQIVFLYFLQKKGWFGVKRGEEWGAGSKRFLRELFDKKHGDYNNFFNDILEPLFYEALRAERGGVDDYYSRFDCRIPFLNGGLFDPIGDYDWVKTEILLPNELFSNSRETKEGDKGDGILDIFDRYNFTVKEDEPLEKEVAIDPEMLGKVFENLLEVKDRKSKGTYYTPREIVHYMCQESLIGYLATEIEGEVTREDIERLIRYGEAVVENESHVADIGRETGTYLSKLPESIRSSTAQIDEKLASIRVCDPAVGSGAFIVGMMNEIVKARGALTLYIQKDEERTAYDFKRHAIRECLYGVDIDASAVDIAKLRLWLSLVVDEEKRETIQPLPNLDYKIVQGNSLLDVEKKLFIHESLSELDELKPLYFEETSTRKKQLYKRRIEELIREITGGYEEFDFKMYFSEVFHEKKGFDVVIGNPPYISHDKINEKQVLAKKFRSYAAFADIYCYFIEVAINLQNDRGMLCFITSNSYIKADYGRPLRTLLLKKDHILCILNIENFQVFDNAIVNTAVLIARRQHEQATPKCLIVNAQYDGNVSFESFVNKNKFFYTQGHLLARSWYLLPAPQRSLKRKIEDAGKSLEMYGTKIRLGIATGANKVFVIDEIQRDDLIKKDERNTEIIKPILQGRDIFRYNYQFNKKYIILATNEINIKDDYPSIYRYFDSFGDSFKKRSTTGRNWWNLRATAFLDDFKKENIIWIELTDHSRFALCLEEIFLLNSAYFLIPPDQFNPKYLLAVLNSNLIEFYLRFIAETSGMGVSRWINNYVKDFPIPEVSEDSQKPFINIVDTVLAITKDDDYSDNTAKQAQVREYERQIDELVYQLYGLTAEEIRMVEGEGR